MYTLRRLRLVSVIGRQRRMFKHKVQDAKVLCLRWIHELVSLHCLLYQCQTKRDHHGEQTSSVLRISKLLDLQQNLVEIDAVVLAIMLPECR